jgi:hypothetical protein
VVDRRIIPDQQEKHREDDRLKNIAGLIQKLSYRDMQRFSKLLAPNSGDAELAERLLDVADIILKDNKGPAF